MVTAISAAAKPSGTVDVQILALNDFHGNLVPPSGSAGRTGIMINGVPIDPDGLYQVTVNSFLADGGDGFTVLAQGTDAWVVMLTWMLL